jgi:DnaJ-class molecular chaperone
MSKNPYETLGVKKDATAAQIKSAYLKLAKQHHPDLNPGDKKAEERFKMINAANDLLGDAEKRARFDRGEIDASGQERPPQQSHERKFYRGFAEGAQGGRYRGAGPGGADTEAFHDIFADLFRNQGQGGPFPGGTGAQARDFRMRGADQRYQLSVSFIEAALGASRRLTLPDGRTLDVTVPPGLESGQVLRLRGQGDPGIGSSPAGDALIEVDIMPHPYFRREGDDIHLDLPVTAAEAALGAKIAVPTPAGPVTMSIPRHSDTGKQLRLRGRGILARGDRPAGDLYVTLKIVLGVPDAALEEALKTFYERHPIDPRQHLVETS